VSIEQLANDIGITPERVASVVKGVRPMDGELDLRLTRYFRLSEGFFLRLQNQYELIKAKRALNGALGRIGPGAA
jgi:addiction module HigA family antidote